MTNLLYGLHAKFGPKALMIRVLNKSLKKLVYIYLKNITLM